MFMNFSDKNPYELFSMHDRVFKMSYFVSGYAICSKTGFTFGEYP